MVLDVAIDFLKETQMSTHWVISQTEKFTSVKLNPKAFRVELYRAACPTLSDFAINVNYSWLGTPIGHLQDYSSKYPSIPLLRYKERPVLEIKPNGEVKIYRPKTKEPEKGCIVVQAGPLLLENFMYVGKNSVELEDFKLDAVRRTDHTAIGVTEAGKLILLYAKQSSIAEIATYLKAAGCSTAMKCDGGSQAAFHSKYFKPLGNTLLSKVGLTFYQKPK